MIGSVSGNAPVDSLISAPEGTVLPFIYRWDPAARGYEMVAEIEPGIGHWIAAISDATLTIDSTSASTAPSPHTRETLDTARPSWESVIAIQTRSMSLRSARGQASNEVEAQRHELVFGMHPSASEGFDRLLDRPLPPFPAMPSNIATRHAVPLQAAWTIEDPYFSLLGKSYVGGSSHASWDLSIELLEPGELEWRHLPTAYRCLLQYDGQAIDMQDDAVICLSEDSDVILTIYDISGKEVRQFRLYRQLAGEYQDKQRAIYWDGRNQTGEPVGSGVYFYRLQAAGVSQTRKLVIIR